MQNDPSKKARPVGRAFPTIDIRASSMQRMPIVH